MFLAMVGVAALAAGAVVLPGRPQISSSAQYEFETEVVAVTNIKTVLKPTQPASTASGMFLSEVNLGGIMYNILLPFQASRHTGNVGSVATTVESTVTGFLQDASSAHPAADIALPTGNAPTSAGVSMNAQRSFSAIQMASSLAPIIASLGSSSASQVPSLLPSAGITADSQAISTLQGLASQVSTASSAQGSIASVMQDLLPSSNGAISPSISAPSASQVVGSSAAPIPTGSTRNCYATYNTCRGQPDANFSYCASRFARCLGYNPFAVNSTDTVTSRVSGVAGSILPTTSFSGTSPSITGHIGDDGEGNSGDDGSSRHGDKLCSANGQVYASGRAIGSTNTYTVYCSQDNSASGAHLFPVSSGGFGACPAACDQQPGCLGWTYLGGERGNCYLKTAQGEFTNASETITSGYKKTPTPGDASASTSTSSSSSQPSSTVAPAAGSCEKLVSGNGTTHYTNSRGAVYNITCKHDIAGGDLKAMAETTFEDCFAACDETVSCVGFSWLEGNGPGTCYLKSSQGTGLSTSPADVAVKVKNAAGLEESHDLPSRSCKQLAPQVGQYAVTCGSDRLGGDLYSVPADGFSGCVPACDAEPKCVGFTYVGGSGPGTCYLKSTLTKQTANGGVDVAIQNITDGVPPSASITSSSSLGPGSSSGSLSASGSGPSNASPMSNVSGSGFGQGSGNSPATATITMSGTLPSGLTVIPASQVPSGSAPSLPQISLGSGVSIPDGFTAVPTSSVQGQLSAITGSAAGINGSSLPMPLIQTTSIPNMLSSAANGLGNVASGLPDTVPPTSGTSPLNAASQVSMVQGEISSLASMIKTSGVTGIPATSIYDLISKANDHLSSLLSALPTATSLSSATRAVQSMQGVLSSIASEVTAANSLHVTATASEPTTTVYIDRPAVTVTVTNGQAIQITAAPTPVTVTASPGQALSDVTKSAAIPSATGGSISLMNPVNLPIGNSDPCNPAALGEQAFHLFTEVRKGNPACGGLFVAEQTGAAAGAAMLTPSIVSAAKFSFRGDSRTLTAAIKDAGECVLRGFSLLANSAGGHLGTTALIPYWATEGVVQHGGDINFDHGWGSWYTCEGENQLKWLERGFNNFFGWFDHPLENKKCAEVRVKRVEALR